MPSFRPNSVVLHPDVEAHYAAIEAAAGAGKTPDSVIWRSFRAAVQRIKADAQWGEVIRKSNIPTHFKRRYGAVNLYCVDLAHFHRAFYTIESRDVIFLDLVDHTQYDKWFPNRGK